MFSKILIASALIAPSLGYSANPAVAYNKVVDAQLEPNKLDSFTEGQLHLDGPQGLIKLTLQPVMPKCDEGMACIQMMPSTQEIEVEGAVATVDHCGIVTIVASKDDRPVDGPLVTITVRDNQNNSCPTLVAMKAIDVQYEQSYYNRFESDYVTETHRFSSDAVSTVDAVEETVTPGQIEYQAVIRAQFEAGNSTRYDSGSLFMDGRKGLLEITLQPKMTPCAEGRMCAAVMPVPFTVSLEGAVSTVDHCGIITTSVMKDQRPVDGAMTKITVRHNQNNTCPTFRALKAVEVVYERAYYDRINGKSVSEIDNFETDTVALIKPRD
jgi:hypothetical protein